MDNIVGVGLGVKVVVGLTVGDRFISSTGVGELVGLLVGLVILTVMLSGEGCENDRILIIKNKTSVKNAKTETLINKVLFSFFIGTEVLVKDIGNLV